MLFSFSFLVVSYLSYLPFFQYPRSCAPDGSGQFSTDHSTLSCTVTEYVQHERPNNSRAWKLKLPSFCKNLLSPLLNGFTICMNADFSLFFKRTFKPFFLKLSILRQRKCLIKPPFPSLILVLEDTLPLFPARPQARLVKNHFFKRIFCK